MNTILFAVASAGLLFGRNFDGNLKGQNAEGVKQNGSYAMKAGDVYLQGGEKNPAAFTATPRGKGLLRYSPWYNDLSVPSDFTFAIACRCSSSPNEILANLGRMRSQTESLVLATESETSVKLAVVAGAQPQVVRSVSIPVKGGVRGFHSYVLRRGEGDTVTVAVDGLCTGKSIVYRHSDSSLQLLGGYNKQRELGNFAHGCRNEANVIDDVRIWGRVLTDAEVGEYAKEFPATAAPAPTTAAINAEWPVLNRFDRQHVQQTVLPLGGIGCGTIGLMGRGELRDWELFNRPNVGTARDRPVFAITAKGAKTPTASVLLAGPTEDYEQVDAGGHPCPYSGYPRFAEATMDAAFPFATVHLRDAKLPYRVDLKAFSPFVPGDSAASSTPVASFEYVVENLTDEPLEISVANFGRSVLPAYHQVRESDALYGLETTSSAEGKSAEAGSYVLVTEKAGAVVTYRTSGIADGWQTNALNFWDDFTDDGRLEPREFLPNDKRPFGALCVAKTVPARGKASFRFAYAWNFPNRYGWCKKPVGNWYSKYYADGWDAAQKIWPKLPDLAARSSRFVQAFLSSDLPGPIKDAALNNLTVLTSQTLFRDGEGRLMGYEGMGRDRGWCKGTTTHVWNYEYATGALFGDLARSTREIEFKHSTFDDGWMAIRHDLPLGTQTKSGWDGRTAADGQMGTVMRAYREWIWSGDTEWLKSIWPKVKVALEFAWKGSGWDPNADGIMEGEQHNTFDINFYGPNPLCQFWYLGALRAGEEMAKAMGDPNFANECRRIFESGRKLTDEKLFNGDYYWQIIPEDKKGEIFQLGTGCLSDQLLGQMAAHILGLGDLGVREHQRQACASIMKFNFLEDFTHHFCDRRTYCAGEDRGLLISSWPRGGREKVPFVYFSEVWTGIEYVAAAEMIYQGMEQDALKIVAAARARHDGRRRNPFNEFECGFHYARSLAAWNLQLAWSGFQYNGVTRQMSFGRDGRWFWSNGKEWGVAEVKDGKCKIEKQ